MIRNAAIQKSSTQNFYDRIADVHHFTLKLNGYRASVAKFLRSLNLEIGPDSYVLDAGSGTGLVTRGFLDAGFRPKQMIAFDLSRNSLSIARDQLRKDKKKRYEKVSEVQGNVLELPFQDGSFDLVLSCGVLEYVSLDEGLKEMARILRPGGKLVFIPVKPSLVGSVLEFLYKFKIHPVENVRQISQRYFTIVGDHKFPLSEPISWSKAIFLLEKKDTGKKRNDK
ncbi:MAG: class I SAM-dependent methyltransferase [Pyrinomonadaceae bacterium]